MNLLQLLISNLKKLSIEVCQKERRDFAQRREVKYTFNVMEGSIPFLTLVNLVDAEDFNNEKNRTPDLPLQKRKVSSELEPQNYSSDINDLNPEINFIQTREPKDENKPHFQKHCFYCHQSNTSVSKCFRKQQEDEKRSGIILFRDRN